MSVAKSLTSGIAGSVLMTILHESINRMTSDAPRLDLMGEEVLHKMNPDIKMNTDKAYLGSLAGELASNSLFYSFIGSGKNAWMKGLLLGAGAGFAAVVLPKYLGLNEEYSNRSPKTRAITIGLYAVAGLASGFLKSSSNK